MGQEARCRVRLGDRVAEGKAFLETDELVFRGDDGLRLRVPFTEMRSVEARAGELRFESPEGAVVLELGGHAEKWAQKILNPKSLLDKLGVKTGMRVLVSGLSDEGFLADLQARTDNIDVGGAGAHDRNDYDAVFVAIDEPQGLGDLATLKHAIKSNGAVWAVFRKGRKDFNENDVLRGGLGAGLVDVKVVRFSDTHTASKFVIRKAERAGPS